MRKMISNSIGAIAIVFGLLLGGSVVLADQPGTYDTVDWNAGQFDPGGGMESTEGLRRIHNRTDQRAESGKKMLKKKEALAYLGDVEKTLTSGNYTGEILLRTKTDPTHNTLSDGIIFNTNGGRNYYAVRRDGENVIVIDAPGGREELVVTEENFPKFENAIHDDNDTPYVIFDQNGNEAAIVFVEWHTRVKQEFNKRGEVIITLKGAKSVSYKGKISRFND